MEDVTVARSTKRKRNNSDKGATHLPLVIKDSIKRLFDRKFVFHKPDDVTEHPAECCTPLRSGTKPWQIPCLITMKHELNDLKNNLNDKDMVTWHRHTRSVNHAGYISQRVKAEYRPEMCTQAWCKFYEIACTYLQVETGAPLFSVHLCEAPGAFVTSLNHYLLSSGFQGNWSWLATTLNPYYEGNSIRQMIDDDKFIRSSHGNWYFGEDGTGNLMSERNLSGLVEKLQDTQVQLVTADGSIDCQDDPAEQESVVCRLQYCEVVTAMHVLSPGGTLVVKMFTLFECRGICLLYLLYSVFDQVNVFKPCTSKGGNSEVYVVCQGYKGKQSCSSYLSLLTEKYFGDREPEGCIFDLPDIPQAFLDQHIQCARFFTDCQMTSIQRNLDLYKVTTETGRSRLEQEKEYCMECFFARYPLQPMVGQARIMRPGKRRHPRPNTNTTRSDQTRSDFASRVRLEGKFTGSFQERQTLLGLLWQQKVFQYETYEEEVGAEDNSLWIRCMDGPLCDRDVEGMTLQVGQRIDKIYSSRFCHGSYIAQTQQIMDNVQWLREKTVTSPELTDTIVKRLLTVIKTALQYTDPGGPLLNQSDSKNNHPQCAETNSSFISWKNWTGSNELCQDNAALDKDNVDTSLKEINSNCNCSLASEESVSMVSSKADCERGEVGVTAERACGDRPMAEQTRHGPENESQSDVKQQTSTDTVEEQKPVTEDVDGTADIPLSCCIKCRCEREHSKICHKLGQATSGRGGVVRLYTAACDRVSGRFDLAEQTQLCQVVMDILKTCGWGEMVVIEMGTSLSRVTAGLVYLLYRSFLEIGFVHHHGNLLRRHLVCTAFQHSPAGVHQHLSDAWEKMNQDHTDAVLEIVPLYTMLEDSEFVSFLQISNGNLLQSFITTVISQERHLYTDNGSEQSQCS